MHRVSGDGESGARDVVLLEIRQRLRELLSPFVIAAGDVLGPGTSLPDTQHPDPVEASVGQTIEFGIRNVVQRRPSSKRT